MIINWCLLCLDVYKIRHGNKYLEHKYWSLCLCDIPRQKYPGNLVLSIRGYHHRAAIVSRGWAKASACHLQVSISCAVLCHIVLRYTGVIFLYEPWPSTTRSSEDPTPTYCERCSYSRCVVTAWGVTARRRVLSRTLRYPAKTNSSGGRRLTGN